MDAATAIALIAAIPGVITFLLGIVFWHSARSTKSYAAQRDFEHLKRNYQVMAEALQLIDNDIQKSTATTLKEIDTRCDRLDGELIQIKALLLARKSETN
jgi:Flp pilus assembly protein TadB